MHFIGCDVSKATLDLAYHSAHNQSRTQHQQVTNNPAGWAAMVRWAKQHTQQPPKTICFVLEATGVYHLKAANYLVTAGLKVIIVNPGRAADYNRSQNRINKSDRLDASALQRYGRQLEKYHYYQPHPKAIQQLSLLLNRLEQLNKDHRRESNRLEKCDFMDHNQPLRQSIKRLIQALRKEQRTLQTQIDQLIQQQPQLQQNQQLMCSITGIGKMTSQTLLPLFTTQRFHSAREAAAFLGLTPRHKHSGTSLKARPQLSGRGNPQLRASLFMPALSASQHNPQLRAFYHALIERGKTPKQAITAIMRKLVHLCYGVIKHQTPYQQNYAP